MTAARVSRQTVKSVLAIEMPEGVGATVRRSIGTSALRNFTPFLMLDHFNVGPGAGFPDHPHRGMTTLTYMLKGSFQHEDFTGRKGIIEPGDLQFMIAGRGISHAEMPIHGGGRDNPIGLQLWIDLPKQHKMVEPSYQELKADQVPTAVVNPFVSMKVISGKADAENGKVVESPVRPLGGCWFFDVTITKKGESVFQAIPQGWNSFIYTLEGDAIIGDNALPVGSFHTTVLTASSNQTGILVTSASDKSRFVIIAGEPLDQEIVQHGPMVMTSRAEIIQAFTDYQRGENGFEGAAEWRSEIGGQ